MRNEGASGATGEADIVGANSGEGRRYLRSIDTTQR